MTRQKWCIVQPSINGSDYIVTFDVEVHPQTNNYRTHKVINEIDLTPVANATTLSSTDTAPAAAVNDNSSSLSDDSIPNFTENVNKPTGRTMAEDTGTRNTSGTVATDTGVQGSTDLNVSRTRTNTMMNSETTTGQEAEQYMPERDFTYESVSEKESMQRAAALVNENGVDSVE